MTGTNVEKKEVLQFVELISADGVKSYTRADPKVTYLLVVLGRTVKEFECPEEANAAEKEILDIQLEKFLEIVGMKLREHLSERDDELAAHLDKKVRDYVEYWNEKFNAVSAAKGAIRRALEGNQWKVQSANGKKAWANHPKFKAVSFLPLLKRSRSGSDLEV